MDVLLALRQAEVPMALIHDEYGHFEGIVTPSDLLAAIAGRLPPTPIRATPLRWSSATTDLCWSRAPWRRMRWPTGWASTCPTTAITRPWQACARRIPPPAGEGESFVEQGWRFEVVDLDGRRIDKLLVSEA